MIGKRDSRKVEKEKQENRVRPYRPVPRFIEYIGRVTLESLVIAFVCVVLGFALAYRVLGPLGHGIKNAPDFLDSLYFSFVTISSRGYGDFQPEGLGTALAAAEVLVGLFFVGIFVARLVSARQEALLDFLANERLSDLAMAMRTDPDGPFSGQYAPLDDPPEHRPLTDQLILKGRYLTRLRAAIQRVGATTHVKGHEILKEFTDAATAAAGGVNNELEQIELTGEGFHRGDTHRIYFFIDQMTSVRNDLRSADEACILTKLDDEIEELREHHGKLLRLPSEEQP